MDGRRGGVPKGPAEQNPAYRPAHRLGPRPEAIPDLAGGLESIVDGPAATPVAVSGGTQGIVAVHGLDGAVWWSAATFR